MAPSTKSRKTGRDERDLIDRRRVGRVEIAREPSNGVSLRPGTIPLGDQGCQFERFAEVKHADLSRRCLSDQQIARSSALRKTVRGCPCEVKQLLSGPEVDAYASSDIIGVLVASVSGHRISGRAPHPGPSGVAWWLQRDTRSDCPGSSAGSTR